MLHPFLAMLRPFLAMRCPFLAMLHAFAATRCEGEAAIHEGLHGHRALHGVPDLFRERGSECVGSSSEHETMRPACVGMPRERYRARCTRYRSAGSPSATRPVLLLLTPSVLRLANCITVYQATTESAYAMTGVARAR
jgi:hypothetical protein